jgi:hypothetical protein
MTERRASYKAGKGEPAGFVDALLSGLRDAGYEIEKKVLALLLEAAAQACLGCAIVEQAQGGDYPTPLIHLRHEVSPEDGTVWHVLIINHEFVVLMDAPDVAALRATLLRYNEFLPPQYGDRLTVESCELRSGQVVTAWCPELAAEVETAKV